MEISLWIHEADSNERKSQIARLLAKVSRKYTKPSRIDRKRLMNGKLGRKIGNRSLWQIRKPTRPPGCFSRPGSTEILDRCIIQDKKCRVRCGILKSLARYHGKHAHGVMCGEPPKRVVKMAEYLSGIPMPSPRKVECQSAKSRDPLRQRKRASRFHMYHLELRIAVALPAYASKLERGDRKYCIGQ